MDNIELIKHVLPLPVSPIIVTSSPLSILKSIFFKRILISFGIKEKVKNLDYEIKKNPNFDNFTELMKKTLGEIISKPITKRFKNIKSNYNEKLVEKKKKKNIKRIYNLLL